MSKGTRGKLRWHETCPGSGVFYLGPLDGAHVRIWAALGGFMVYGFAGPQIDIWVKDERGAKAAARRALVIEWPKIHRRRSARKAREAA